MNYIWDAIIKAKKQGIDTSNISFKIANNYSPYMELSFTDINTKKFDEVIEIEVNPYYRFYNIFKDFFDINFNENIELRNVLFDILMHLLAEVDLKQGFSKNYYYKKFILNDIENGFFSSRIKENFENFSDEEKEKVVEKLLILYKTSVSIDLFKRVVGEIFPKSIVYINNENKKEILIYLGEKENEERRVKIETLIELFLDIKFIVFLYWEYHFGILGVEDTMVIENMVIY